MHDAPGHDQTQGQVGPEPRRRLQLRFLDLAAGLEHPKVNLDLPSTCIIINNSNNIVPGVDRQVGQKEPLERLDVGRRVALRDQDRVDGHVGQLSPRASRAPQRHPRRADLDLGRAGLARLLSLAIILGPGIAPANLHRPVGEDRCAGDALPQMLDLI